MWRDRSPGEFGVESGHGGTAHVERIERTAAIFQFVPDVAEAW
jgi:hypothetical protein